MKKSISILEITVMLFLFLLAGQLFSQASGYKVTATINIGGEGRWDYCIVDTVSHRLFVSHGTKVHVIDLSNNSAIGEITGLNGVHGIAFAYDFNKGYISNGKNDTVTVFDLKSLKVTGNIPVTGKNPDAIIYDPYSKRIFTFNGRSSNATAIDAKTDKVAGTIALDGKPEFSVSDLKGRMFVNIEDKSIIEEFDPKGLKVIAKWAIAPALEPSGMAIDLKNSRIFTVGSNKKMAVLDTKTGKIVADIPIGSGVDACAYDPAGSLVFSSNGEGTLTVIKQQSADDYKVLENVATFKSMRTMALDPATHKVYLIGTIEGKDNIKSFGVLVVSM